MARQIGNFETDVTITSDTVYKITQRPFQDVSAARNYCDDLESYIEQLKVDGLAIPDVLASGISETIQPKVYQESRRIEGVTIQDDPSVAKLTELAEVLRELPRDKYGRFANPVDPGLGNFMHDSNGKLWTVDTMPPYMDVRSGDFPYYRLANGNLSLVRAWADRYVRSPEGAATRLVAVGARALSMASDEIDFPSACRELAHLSPNHSKALLADLPIFFAATVAMRSIRSVSKQSDTNE